jgi:tripartite-type tricarboxylate transporter receptor subunit TctC
MTERVFRSFAAATVMASMLAFTVAARADDAAPMNLDTAAPANSGVTPPAQPNISAPPNPGVGMPPRPGNFPPPPPGVAGPPNPGAPMPPRLGNFPASPPGMGSSARPGIAAAMKVDPIEQAKADAWPERAVTIVVPFAAGGSADLLARMVAQHLQEDFGKPVIVENRSGAGGSIGTAFVAKASKDGYTLLLGTFSTMVLNEFMYSHLPYDTEADFQPVAQIVSLPNLFVINNKIPVATVPQFVEYLQAHDGKMTYGSSGVGTSSQLSVIMLQMATGAHFTHVPFRSTADELTNLMNGSIDFAIDSMTTLWPAAQAGNIRALAVSSKERSPAAPDLPSIGQFIKSYGVSSWQGLFAPGGTPKPLAEKIALAIKRDFSKPEVVEQLTKLGGVQALKGPDEFSSYILSEEMNWRDVVKFSGIHLE